MDWVQEIAAEQIVHNWCIAYSQTYYTRPKNMYVFHTLCTAFTQHFDSVSTAHSGICFPRCKHKVVHGIVLNTPV